MNRLCNRGRASAPRVRRTLPGGAAGTDRRSTTKHRPARATKRWRFTPFKIALLLGAFLFLPAAAALAQNGQRGGFVLQSLQPHSAHIALRERMPEPQIRSDEPPGGRPQRLSPRDVCLGQAAVRRPAGHTAPGSASSADETIEACTALIDAARRPTPALAIAYSRRGEARRLRGDHGDAVADFARAIKLDPRRAAHFVGRGLAYRDLAELGSAVEDFDRALKLEPRDAEAYRQRAALHRELRNDALAIADFGQAIRLDAENVEARYGRASIHLERRHYDRAIRDLDRALDIRPDHAAAFHLRGIAYVGKGETRRAIQDFDQAIALDRDFARAYRNRADLHYGNANYRRAIEDYSRAVEFNPKDAYSLFSRGLAHRAAGDEAAAAEDIARANAIEPGIAPAPAAEEAGLEPGDRRADGAPRGAMAPLQ